MDRSRATSLFDQLIDIGGILLVVGTLFLFLPGTADPFFFHKNLFVAIGAALLFLFWAIRSIISKKLIVSVNPLLLPLVLLLVASIVSTVATNVSLAKALFSRIGPVASTVLVFFVFSSRSTRFARRIERTLAWSAVILALWSLSSFTGFTMTLLGSSSIADKTFTPVGSTLMLFVTLIAILPLLAKRVQHHPAPAAPDAEAPKPRTADAIKTLGALCGIVVALSAGVVALITLYPSFFGSTPSFLPLSYGWQVAIEVLKERMFFGVGPGRFLAAFTQYRPALLNTTPLWNQRFFLAPNELLHVFTENGMVGFIALLFVLWSIIRLVREDVTGHHPVHAASIALLIVGASAFVAPFSIISFILLATFGSLAVIAARHERDGSSWNARVDIVALREGMVKFERSPMSDGGGVAESGKNLLSWLVGIIALLWVAGILTASSRAWSAEFAFNDALTAIAENDGTSAYNALQQTVSRNPWFDNYHRQYSDVNLRLANSLGSRTAISDEDRTNVSRLIQQAIRESRVAVQIDPSDVRNWETLAGVYRALIPVAQGARDFTLLSYSEAVRRDPSNPVLRLLLGGIFYSSSDWENAIRNFQTAVSLKPDYANGYYNLALAYEQNNRPGEAVRAIQATLQNLDASSRDYQIASTKLSELLVKSQSSAPTGETAPQTEEAQLSAPEPLPTAVPGANRVTLGQEESPPITPQPTIPSGAQGASPTPRP